MKSFGAFYRFPHSAGVGRGHSTWLFNCRTNQHSALRPAFRGACSGGLNLSFSCLSETGHFPIWGSTIRLWNRQKWQGGSWHRDTAENVRPLHCFEIPEHFQGSNDGPYRAETCFQLAWLLPTLLSREVSPWPMQISWYGQKAPWAHTGEGDCRAILFSCQIGGKIGRFLPNRLSTSALELPTRAERSFWDSDQFQAYKEPQAIMSLFFLAAASRFAPLSTRARSAIPHLVRPGLWLAVVRHMVRHRVKPS